MRKLPPMNNTAATIRRDEISTAPGSVWVRPAEAAFMLGCGTTYLYQLIREGRLTTRKLGSRMRLISRASIEKIGEPGAVENK
jgi:excisionase family DNA binding protein